MRIVRRRKNVVSGKDWTGRMCWGDYRARGSGGRGERGGRQGVKTVADGDMKEKKREREHVIKVIHK